ncbi:tumor susceptibility gene 101 protein [Brachyhypopomus gauderio]|uniref:tumor susceptibility gene 101 protein n=1 Tax=Brachyhypopomus gauderio TaxID=698409 RepID=UPI0040412279
MTTVSLSSLKTMLPKTYEYRKEVIAEIITVLSRYKNLEPVVDRFVYNDGTVERLMSLAGTIQVVWQGRLYNTPVCLWLEQNYPHSAPICYVKPTKEMMVITSSHVDNNGQVQLPYLDEWTHAECDLNSLIQVMIAVFGETPPLCMQPKADKTSEQALRKSQACSMAENGYVTLWREDGLPFQGNNETSC